MVIKKWNKEYRKEYRSKYYQKNKKIADAKSKIYYEKNKEKIDAQRKVYAKKYYKENRAKILEDHKKYTKKYYQENRDKIKLQVKINYIKNRDKILLKQKIYRKNYLNNNPTARISGRLRVLLLKALNKYTKTGKHQSSRKYGIDYQKIIDHLKPFPEDLSKYHIDHIKPLCSFDLTNLEEIKKAFAPENHQWLLAEDNLRKGGKY